MRPLPLARTLCAPPPCIAPTVNSKTMIKFYDEENDNEQISDIPNGLPGICISRCLTLTVWTPISFGINFTE